MVNHLILLIESLIMPDNSYWTYIISLALDKCLTPQSLRDLILDGSNW